MVGLSLGGGYGPYSGRLGLAVDNIVSVDIVLADGSLVSADVDHEPDLFWALRGGGENFGVVTAMRLRLHAEPTILAGRRRPSAGVALVDRGQRRQRRGTSSAGPDGGAASDAV
jgi:FAD/FMN-containing dehydrogenase